MQSCSPNLCQCGGAGANRPGCQCKTCARVPVYDVRTHGAESGKGRAPKSFGAGLFRELNPGPLAPEARIIPLDQTANCPGRTTRSWPRSARCAAASRHPPNNDVTRGGTRTHNLLPRREAPYPLGQMGVATGCSAIACSGAWQARQRKREFAEIRLARRVNLRRLQETTAPSPQLQIACRRFVLAGGSSTGGANPQRNPATHPSSPLRVASGTCGTRCPTFRAPLPTRPAAGFQRSR